METANAVMQQQAFSQGQLAGAQGMTPAISMAQAQAMAQIGYVDPHTMLPNNQNQMMMYYLQQQQQQQRQRHLQMAMHSAPGSIAPALQYDPNMLPVITSGHVVAGGSHEKRGSSVKREPLRTQFKDDASYMAAWLKWREARNNNNLAVNKCRSKAKKKGGDTSGKSAANSIVLLEHKTAIISLLEVISRLGPLSATDAAKVQTIQNQYANPNEGKSEQSKPEESN